jgi:hypothetical protein
MAEEEKKNILEVIGDFFLGIAKGFSQFFDPNKKQVSAVITETGTTITNKTPFAGTEVLTVNTPEPPTANEPPKPPVPSLDFLELGKKLNVQLLIEDKGRTLNLGDSYDGSKFRFTAGDGTLDKFRWIYKYGNQRFELNVFPAAPVIRGIPMRFKVKNISSRYTFGIKCNGKTIFSGLKDGDELPQQTKIV